MRMLDQVLERARGRRAEAEAALFELISIPSVSALPDHRDDCRRAAGWVAARLRAAGMEARLVDVREDGHPVVVAEWLGRPGAPTLTIYGHYDVQPPDPVEEWRTPPFEPTVRDGFVYGRGADDNKAQHLASILAIEHWFANGGPPVNLRFLIEGEEEVGGRSLPDYVQANAADLAADYLIVADGSLRNGRPHRARRSSDRVRTQVYHRTLLACHRNSSLTLAPSRASGARCARQRRLSVSAFVCTALRIGTRFCRAQATR